MTVDGLGHPGARGGLMLVPGIRMTMTDPRTGAHEMIDRSERPFDVQVLLAKGPVFDPKISLAFGPEQGASFVGYPTGVTAATLTTPEGLLHLHLNADCELAMASGTITAPTIHDAHTNFMKILAPFLDHMAYLANVPIVVSKTRCCDPANGAVWIEYVVPYGREIVSPNESVVATEMVPVFALYREAKNATSSYYRFLCYFKIMEGIYGDLRGKLFTSAKARGVPIKTRKERVPVHPELENEWPELIGKPIKELFDGRFQTEYRNAIAHPLTDSKGWLVLSDLSTDHRFAGILTLLELCCREVIATHLDYLSQLNR